LERSKRVGRSSDDALDSPPGFEVFPYTPEEFESERARKNPIVLEAGKVGIDLLDNGAAPARR
jgi:hypothetical protein